MRAVTRVSFCRNLTPIFILNCGHIRSNCNVTRAGGWNIWATDLPNYVRNPLPPNNQEAVEDSSPPFMMRCLLFRESKYEIEGHINTSKRSSKRSILREWFVARENYSRWPFPGNKLLALRLSLFNNLPNKCILNSNFSVLVFFFDQHLDHIFKQGTDDICSKATNA